MTPPFPDRKYSIIYADPPWSFSRGAWGGSVKQPTAYERMESEDIAGLPVGDLCGKNAVLFLWTTSSHLPDSLDVCAAWGFKYHKVGFVWVKTTQWGVPIKGLGRTTRNAAEFCLLCARGKGLPILSHSEPQVIMAERRKHSQKPAEVRDRIVRLYGDVPRIELFARQRVPGWDAWGLEVPPVIRQRTLALGELLAPGIGVGEAAAILGVCIGTVRNWADKGELPHWRTPGGQRRFERALIEWIAKEADKQ